MSGSRLSALPPQLQPKATSTTGLSGSWMPMDGEPAVCLPSEHPFYSTRHLLDRLDFRMPPRSFGKKKGRKKKHAEQAQSKSEEGKGEVVSEVGRCLLSSSMGCEAGVIATCQQFQRPDRRPIGITVSPITTKY